MASVATNIVSLSLFNQGRKNLIEFCKRVEHLSSGKAITSGADDPSGLGISDCLSAHIRGLSAATQNAQDGVNLLRTADDALGEAHDILFRMKDVATRMANEATMAAPSSASANELISSDERRLFKELGMLGVELKRSLAGVEKAPPAEPDDPTVNFNGKILFNGSFEDELDQYLQIGPNRGGEYMSKVVIPSMAALVDTIETNDFPGNFTLQDFVSYARSHIDEISRDIDMVSQVREEIGTQVITLGKVINDISAEFVNNSDFNSRITDADMANETVELAKIQLLNQMTETFASQVNLDAILVMPLLTAITSTLPGGTMANVLSGAPEAGIGAQVQSPGDLKAA
jgi:flagellin